MLLFMDTFIVLSFIVVGVKEKNSPIGVYCCLALYWHTHQLGFLRTFSMLFWTPTYYFWLYLFTLPGLLAYKGYSVLYLDCTLTITRQLPQGGNMAHYSCRSSVTIMA